MSDAETLRADIISLGVVSYREAWELQSTLHRDVVEGRKSACIILLEHAPVLTLGKHGDPLFVLSHSERLAAEGVELVQTDRGGEVTAHMPGQLVVYPILPLQALRIAPKMYVQKLMEVVISTLREFGIEAGLDSEHPGVWVGREKICAVGVRIRERVSMHGLALNINNRLQLFETIVPCGIRGRGVCSMQSILGEAPSRERVEGILLKRFFEAFGWDKMINLSS